MHVILSVPDHLINFAYMPIQCTLSVTFIGQIKIGICQIIGIFFLKHIES